MFLVQIIPAKNTNAIPASYSYYYKLTLYKIASEGSLRCKVTYYPSVKLLEQTPRCKPLHQGKILAKTPYVQWR